MTEVRAIITRKQLHHIPRLRYHVRFRSQGVLRFPFGENEALLLRYSVCQRNGIWPYLLAKIQNLYNKTTLKAKKLLSSVKIPLF